ncbi:hypothetical protein [Endozoicomonas atrinae]|nr:hypothetical protein [Endozoicomonas atrinae]
MMSILKRKNRLGKVRHAAIDRKVINDQRCSNCKTFGSLPVE